MILLFAIIALMSFISTGVCIILVLASSGQENNDIYTKALYISFGLLVGSIILIGIIPDKENDTNDFLIQNQTPPQNVDVIHENISKEQETSISEIVEAGDLSSELIEIFDNSVKQYSNLEIFKGFEDEEYIISYRNEQLPIDTEDMVSVAITNYVNFCRDAYRQYPGINSFRMTMFNKIIYPDNTEDYQNVFLCSMWQNEFNNFDWNDLYNNRTPIYYEFKNACWEYDLKPREKDLEINKIRYKGMR